MLDDVRTVVARVYKYRVPFFSMVDPHVHVMNTMYSAVSSSALSETDPCSAGVSLAENGRLVPGFSLWVFVVITPLVPSSDWLFRKKKHGARKLTS